MARPTAVPSSPPTAAPSRPPSPPPSLAAAAVGPAAAASSAGNGDNQTVVVIAVVVSVATFAIFSVIFVYMWKRRWQAGLPLHHQDGNSTIAMTGNPSLNSPDGSLLFRNSNSSSGTKSNQDAQTRLSRGGGSSSSSSSSSSVGSSGINPMLARLSSRARSIGKTTPIFELCESIEPFSRAATIIPFAQTWVWGGQTRPDKGQAQGQQAEGSNNDIRPSMVVDDIPVELKGH